MVVIKQLFMSIVILQIGYSDEATEIFEFPQNHIRLWKKE